MFGFSISMGRSALASSGETSRLYLIIVVGIIAHWVWEVLVAGVTSGGTFDFGSLQVIGARVVIAAIAGAWSFTGIYEQIKSSPFRGFAAFTAGFAVEALTGPVVDGVAAG